MSHELIDEAASSERAVVPAGWRDPAAARRAGAGPLARPRAGRAPRVAIVHDWLVTYAGAERVLEQIIACFPDADLFAVVDFVDDRAFLRGKPVTTSFIQRLPLARKKYRAWLPLMPLAIEQLDVSGYDVVISSSHAVAKGVLTGPDQFHISYVHSPIRYAWDLQHQYLKESHLTRGLKSALARLILHYIRNWDVRTANSVDQFVANSAFIARRIHKVYQRDAAVVFPPVDVDAFALETQKEDFYLTASRLVPYKKIDLIVEAFARTPHRKLVVIGDGPDMQKIRAKAAPNVEVLGYQPFAVLHDRMRRAKAFVFAAEEDFGISVVEAQACGTPVIAYGKGGALETVRDFTQSRPTGFFFEEQSADAIVAAVDAFEREPGRIRAEDCRANAERFSAARFRERFIAEVAKAVPGVSAGAARRMRAADPPPARVPPAPGTPRVLAIDQSGVLGGAELSLLEVVKGLRARIDVVLFDDGPFREALDAAGARVEVLAANGLRHVRRDGGAAPRLSMLTGIASLVRATRRRARDADVLYANTQRAMVIGVIAGKLARKPVVWHLRDIVSADHFGRVQRAVIKGCAKLGLAHVIANSEASASVFAALTNFDAKRIDVVHNGVDEAPFDALNGVSQAQLRERIGLPRDVFLVGAFSRLARWKGQHVLLEALLKERDVHAVFVGAPLFGEDAYDAELRAFVAAHGLADRVHFLGFRHDIAACMRAVDVVAHTSITPEPFGRVVVEGMLARRPVVASRDGGVTEIVEHGANGLLCKPGDADELAATIAALRADPALRERLGASGLETARRRFGKQRYVAAVERVLTDVAMAS
ncbi:glycosyltransferase involved in cell wall biosynthesis [Paraburkholderia caballeronis]|uniref:glycosyltransferase family 4 protein n=1 Tax=Paraburkholderia caballeronis TaxID=416943 RepID=UPI0010E7EA02|nr:glycosyltransferase family 4 protein [Paraburkholderia caballeronis]TDV39101.1 glycosyltransferase involved in cell wall biosynthesis [Paraburkholderia caballeronis]